MGAISYKALVITVRTVEDHMRATKRDYIMYIDPFYVHESADETTMRCLGKVFPGLDITITEEHPGFVFNDPYDPQIHPDRGLHRSLARQKSRRKMNTPQERYQAIAEAAKTLTELTSTLQLQTIQDTNIEELAGCYSSFGPSDLFEALAAEAAAPRRKQGLESKRTPRRRTNRS